MNTPKEFALAINAAINSHECQWKNIDRINKYILQEDTPFNAEELKNNGYDWKNNWNYGRGRSQIEQGVINNVGDIGRSLSTLDIEFKKFDRNIHRNNLYFFLVDDNAKEVISFALCSAFLDTLEDDERFDWFLNVIEYNSYSFGYCPIIRDKNCYLGHPASINDVAFEDKTKIGQPTTFIIFDTTKMSILYDIYNENINRESVSVDYDGHINSFWPNGWCKEGMLQALCQYINSLELKKDNTLIDKVTTWEQVNKTINDFKNVTDLNKNNIYFAKVYNIDGNDIDEAYILLSSNNRSLDSTYSDHFLFKKKHINSNYTKFLNVVTEYGLNTNLFIQELKGVGKRIAEDALRYDLMRNALQDKLMFGGATWVSAPNSLAGKKSAIKVIGPWIEVDDENFKPIQNQLKIDLRDHLEAIALDDKNHDENIFHYNPKLDLSNRPTKDEVSVKGREVSNQRKSKLPTKLKNYSKLLHNILISLSNDAENNPLDKEKKEYFFNRVNEILSWFSFTEISNDNIRKIIKEISRIHIFPANNDVQAITAALSMASSSSIKKKLMIMYLLAIGFTRRQAWEFVSLAEYGNEVDKASFENTQFYTTSEVTIGIHQDHIAHLNMHFPKMDRVLKGVVGGEDPVKGFNFLTNALINTASHIEHLQSNPFFSKKAKEFEKIQAIFESKAKQLAQTIEELKQKMTQEAVDKQQPQQQGLPPEVLQKLKIQEVNAIEKIKRTNMLTEASMQKRKEMFDLEQDIRRKQADTGIELSKELAGLKKDLELLKQSANLAKNV